MTRVRKIDGDPAVLRDELRVALGFIGKVGGKGVGKVEDCVVNPLTRQVVMKGHFKPQVERLLRERML